ncbi:MAG: hypothetical protein ACOC9P_02465 [bacterium]
MAFSLSVIQVRKRAGQVRAALSSAKAWGKQRSAFPALRQWTMA